jgi:hypothetical protein
MNSIDLLRRLDPTAGADPARDVSAETRAELQTRITATPFPATAKRHAVRRRLVPALVAAGVVAAVVVTVTQFPGGSRQEALGPALSFSAEGNYLRVRIVDPLADTARYNKELEEHGLDVTLRLLPGSPSVVGLAPGAVFGPGSKNIKQTEDPAGCVRAGTYPCVPQFLIPKNYAGHAELVVARAAAPGERISFGGEIDGRGEALQGVKYRGMQVSQVLTILKQRGYTVPEYRLNKGTTTTSPTTVPASYTVTGGFLLQDKQVILKVTP